MKVEVTREYTSIRVPEYHTCLKTARWCFFYSFFLVPEYGSSRRSIGDVLGLSSVD